MKCKTKLIPKLHNVSSVGMRLFFFLIRRANESDAIVRGVYYKDVAKYAEMSVQSVYNALAELQEKNIIKVTRESDLDYDVYIIDNEYPEGNYKAEPYINFNMKVFFSKEFKGLKAKEKYLMLEFLKCSYESSVGIKRSVKEFYAEMTKLLKVTERVLRSYLHTLKEYFSIGIKDGLYRIRQKKNTSAKALNSKSNEMWNFEQIVRSECNRCRIQYEDKSLSDTAKLIQTFRSRFEDRKTRTQTTAEILIRSIQKSIEYVDKECRELSAPYINKLMNDAISKL